MFADYLPIGVFLALVFCAATTGALFSPGPWYESLAKPSWTPPNWLFPVAWTVLYLMIGIAGWLVWKADGFGLALVLWGVHLAFNAAWSYFMFGAQRIDYAMYDVTGMWVTMVAFMLVAWPVSQTAVLLFLPYLAWVSFAAVLNWRIWELNA
ncbi:MAG: TspO/MBR family protein [Pseudomonadota bacterium]